MNTNFLQLAQERYTTKQYQSETKIPQKDIDALQEILRLTPSSINSQPWNFIFVSDEEMKRKLAEASYFNKEKINQASHLVVFNVFSDIEKFEERIKKYLPEGAVNYYLQGIKPQGEAVVRAWLKNQVYISLGFFLSACASMGIDSTAMEGIDTKIYTETLSLDGFEAVFAVAIGYRHSQDNNQPQLKPKSRIPKEEVIQNR